MLVGWWPKPGWQLRLRITLPIETSGLEVSACRAPMKLQPSAHDYLAALPPSTPVERFQPERGSREHLVVVTTRVDEMDWLELLATELPVLTTPESAVRRLTQRLTGTDLPLLGLLQVPLCGPGRQLCGKEIRAANVSSGSEAVVWQRPPARNVRRSLVRVQVGEPDTSRGARRRSATPLSNPDR